MDKSEEKNKQKIREQKGENSPKKRVECKEFRKKEDKKKERLAAVTSKPF